MRIQKILPVLLCAAAVSMMAPSGARAAQGGLRCADVTFPVTLSAADPTVYQVTGELCSRGSLHGKTIQITLHGSTTSHLYWDWPYQPALYSYVRSATAAGYAVLNLDRIGVGRSDHPPADAVTIDANAFVVHQIVQALRGGSLTVPSFGRVRAGRVALVGHSLGSVISIAEAATYGDVDGVVLTGVSHTVSAELGNTLSTFQPANLDPHFAGRNIPDGYLTSAPGQRGFSYHAPFFDPQVLALDEQTKETVTVGELNTAFPALALSTSVHVPVLVVVGNDDPFFCGDGPTCADSGSLAAEPSFYPADACAETFAAPASGHNVNLHFTAPLAFNAIHDWMDRRVGRDAGAPVPQPCR